MKATYYIDYFLLLVSSFLFSSNPSYGQSKQTSTVNATDELFIENFLKQYPKQFQNILSNQKKYEVQIIYTQINRDKNNVPSFKQYTYHLDPKNYFYPASLVKLPCAALSLEKLNFLKIPSLDKNTCMQTDSAYACQRKVTKDSTAFNKIPSVANYLKRMLLVSDNDAYSRIYEFLGQQYINNALAKKGYPEIRIVHRFDADCNAIQNKCTNHISFFDPSGKCIYNQPMLMNTTDYKNPIGTIKKGIGYVNEKGKLVHEPKDYTYMNYLSLQNTTDILQSIIFPLSVEKEKRFDLTKEDYSFLYRYLSMYPRESDFPKYNVKDFEDSYKKYFMYGSYHKKIETDSVRIFNIVGQSYGNLIDCAYIVNVDRKIEFMLSAVIYVNEDGIINDGKYEYKTIGFPFLNDLGNVFYNYELKRKKIYLPELSNFKLRY